MIRQFFVAAYYLSTYLGTLGIQRLFRADRSDWSRCREPTTLPDWLRTRQVRLAHSKLDISIPMVKILFLSLICAMYDL